MSRHAGFRRKSEVERKENKQRAMSMPTFPIMPAGPASVTRPSPNAGQTIKDICPTQLLRLCYLREGGRAGVPQDPGALGHVWGMFFRRFAFLKKLIAEAFYLRIGLCLIKSVFLQNFRAKTVSPWILDS